MKAETAIVAAIVEAVNASRDAFVWRNQSGVVRVKRGFMHLAPIGAPDLVGWLRDGRFVAFEVKVPNAKTQKSGPSAKPSGGRGSGSRRCRRASDECR